MIHRDWVIRYVKYAGGRKTKILLERKYCPACRRYVRELPYYIYRFKHYDRRIIDMVRRGKITSETYGYEDYPCEVTMTRWRS